MNTRPTIRGTAATVLLSAGLLQAAQADSPAPPVRETQATIKKLGFGISSITLVPKAARRLDIQTGAIRETAEGGKTAPFSSIIYDLDGDAWVYTVTAPLTYVRESVTIDHVTTGEAYLASGPAPGTLVVIVGVPELYGAEVGVNGE